MWASTIVWQIVKETAADWQECYIVVRTGWSCPTSNCSYPQQILVYPQAGMLPSMRNLRFLSFESSDCQESSAHVALLGISFFSFLISFWWALGSSWEQCSFISSYVQEDEKDGGMWLTGTDWDCMMFEGLGPSLTPCGNACLEKTSETRRPRSLTLTRWADLWQPSWICHVVDLISRWSIFHAKILARLPAGFWAYSSFL